MSVSTQRSSGRSTAVLALLPTRAPRLGEKPGIGDYLRVDIDRRLRDMLFHEAGTRAGEQPEPLHQMRVAVRRMRSVLEDYRRYLDREWVDGLRAELGWLARALGDVRDFDVLISHFRAEIESLHPADRKAARTLLTRLNRKRGVARRKLLRALDSKRFADLTETLATAAVDGVPTLTAEPENRPPSTPASVVDKPFRKLRKQIRVLPENPGDDQLHALRIRGKRLRYATEMVGSAGDEKTKRLIKRTKTLQDVLGDLQDSCVARDEIRALLDTGIDVPTAFAAGRLLEREELRRLAARARWQSAWRAVDQAAIALVD